MAEANFGERLAEARRIKGDTIEDVSEQLRIRPSIILAMETSNFAHMPHKGYARNMVSSYARYLGLESTRITEQFLVEFRRWEHSGKKRNAPSHASNLAFTTNRNQSPDDPILYPDQRSSGRETITAAKRNLERASVWRDGEKGEVDRKFRAQLKQAQDDKGISQLGTRRRPAQKRPDEEVALQSRQVRTNDYVGKPPRKSVFSTASTGLSSRPLLLVIGLVAVFVAILVLWAVLANTCAKNEPTNKPVTGVTASDSGLSEDEVSNNVTDIESQIAEDDKYGAFELTVEVVEGSSWLQIDVDGATPVGEVHDAGWKASYTVSSKCSVQAGAPGYVKVYRNGVEVPLDTSSGTGVVELEVEQRPIVQNAQNADAAGQQ